MSLRRLLCTLLLAVTPAAWAADPPAAPDGLWWNTASIRAAEFDGRERKSWYVPMRDGVRLAVDVWLPAKLPRGTKLPAILEQTRYYRSNVMRADPTGPCKPPGSPTVDLFVTHGYAYVFVDVRGSGASFGTRAIEYSDDEVRDGKDIVDWIVKQPWSNGKVGATGQSYVGTTAEMLVRNHHPAVKAVMPTFSGYDFYNEIVRPGGIYNIAFTTTWAATNRALDAGEGSPLVAGPCPVDGDTDGALLRQAITQHAGNYDLVELLRNVTFRDDRYRGIGVDQASPFSYRSELDRDLVPLYAVSGWNDSAYTAGAIRRYLNSTSPARHLLIGPWNHGAKFFYEPGVRAPTPSAFNLAFEKLRFFDYYLKGIDAGFAADAPVRYFTTGANQWRAASTWPPATTTLVLNFQAGRGLAASVPAPGLDRHTGDGELSSGELNRWHSTQGPFPVAYPDRAPLAARMLTYTSAPLEQDTEVTGVPVVVLHVAIDKTDGDFFAYLEEVTADGQANYVTEGQLRAAHRALGKLPYDNLGPTHTDRRADALAVTPGRAMRLDIAQWPVSHVFRRGSRIRVSLADADRSQFQERPPEAVSWQVFRGPTMASRIELPVVENK